MLVLKVINVSRRDHWSSKKYPWWYPHHSLQWHHNERNCVSNHQPHECLINRLLRHRWKRILKFRVSGLCEGNSPATSEFPAQRASNAENVFIWWRHHVNTNVHTWLLIGWQSIMATLEKFYYQAHRVVVPNNSGIGLLRCIIKES